MPRPLPGIPLYSGAGDAKCGGLKKGEASLVPQVVKSESSSATCKERKQTPRLVKIVVMPMPQ